MKINIYKLISAALLCVSFTLAGCRNVISSVTDSASVAGDDKSVIVDEDSDVFAASKKSGKKKSDTKKSDTRKSHQKENDSNVQIGSTQVGQSGHPGHPVCAKGDILLECDSYISAFSPNLLQPVWTYWSLTPGMGNGSVKRGGFHPDNRLPAGLQVQKGDYSNTHYTRGHMKPAGDCKSDAKAMDDCMRMSNMCPQTGELNAGAWNTIENLCRTAWVNKEQQIYIVCGPLFTQKKVKTISSKKIAVPDEFYKVVLSLRPGHEKAIGFIFANDNSNARMEDGVVSLAEVEKRAGYAMFPNLPADIYSKVKDSKDLSVWTGKYYDKKRK